MRLQAQESAREGGGPRGENAARPTEPSWKYGAPVASRQRGGGDPKGPKKGYYKISFIVNFPKRLEQKKQQNKNFSYKNVPGKLKKRGEPWVESSPVRSRRLRQGTSRRAPCQEGWWSSLQFSSSSTIRSLSRRLVSSPS